MTVFKILFSIIMTTTNTVVDHFNTTNNEVSVPNMKIQLNNVWFDPRYLHTLNSWRCMFNVLMIQLWVMDWRILLQFRWIGHHLHILQPFTTSSMNFLCFKWNAKAKNDYWRSSLHRFFNCHMRVRLKFLRLNRYFRCLMKWDIILQFHPLAALRNPIFQVCGIFFGLLFFLLEGVVDLIRQNFNFFSLMASLYYVMKFDYALLL